MTATTLHHVGVIVEHVETAVEHFSALLGLHFSDPVVYRFDLTNRDGSTETRSLRVALSSEGPPHMELIEGHESGLWTVPDGQGLHHVGALQEDLAARAGELRADGYEADAVVHVAGSGLKAVYLGTDHPHVHNVRFELIQPG